MPPTCFDLFYIVILWKCFENLLCSLVSLWLLAIFYHEYSININIYVHIVLRGLILLLWLALLVVVVTDNYVLLLSGRKK